MRTDAPFHHALHAWRTARQFSITRLAGESGLEEAAIESIEAGSTDPTMSTVEALARGLGIPPAWMHGTPHAVASFMGVPAAVIERMLVEYHAGRDLYALLTALLRHGDPKLIRAADVNLRSLLKQARTATVPWQHRSPGHFEPPSD